MSSAVTVTWPFGVRPVNEAVTALPSTAPDLAVRFGHGGAGSEAEAENGGDGGQESHNLLLHDGNLQKSGNLSKHSFPDGCVSVVSVRGIPDNLFHYIPPSVTWNR